MHIRPLITFSCLFTFIKTLCSLVCVEHSSANSGSTAAVVPLARVNLHLPELRLCLLHSPSGTLSSAAGFSS